MATADAFECFGCAADGAIFGDRVDGVLAAGGMITAVPGEYVPQGGAVEQDGLDEEPLHVRSADSFNRSWD